MDCQHARFSPLQSKNAMSSGNFQMTKKGRRSLWCLLLFVCKKRKTQQSLVGLVATLSGAGPDVGMQKEEKVKEDEFPI